MNKNQIKVITESLALMSKVGTVNALDYIKNCLEAYKKVEIPIVSSDGWIKCPPRIPYEEDKGVKTFIDFMLVYLDEAIKSLEKGKSE